MNIVHVCLPTLPILYERGGAVQRRVLELALAQQRQGHTVSLFSIGNVNETKLHEGVSIEYIKCKYSYFARPLEYQYRLTRVLKRKYADVDVLHVHNFPEGTLFTKGIKCKAVLSYDFFKFRKGNQTPYSLLVRKYLLNYSKLLPVSEYTKQMSRAYWNLPLEKLHVLYNGVSLSQFYPDKSLYHTKRKKLGIEEAEKVILYVGRVNYQKGVHVLVKAMHRLLETRRDLRMVVAGPVSQFGTHDSGNELTQEIRKLNGMYLGAVPENELNAIYNSCDIFVMPTIRNEMFGMSVIEAQACAKPVIASDHGGLRETVPVSCGGRFDTGSATQLATKLAELASDPVLLAQCSENALNNARKYSWEHIAIQALNIYSK